MNNRLSLAFLLAITLLLRVAHGQQEQKPTAYGSLYNEWNSAIEELDAQFPDISKQALRRRERAINEAFTSKFVQLASAHLEDDVWIDCLIWTSVEGVEGKAFDQMFDLLGDNAKNAKNTTQLKFLMSELISLSSERIDPALKNIVASHSNDSVVGAALYALAARTKIRGELHGSRKTCEEAEKLLERVVAEFPDVRTYRGNNRDNATELLNALRSPIAITRKAPDFHGETISREDFHLAASVKGKVAVISFSGHWCGPCVAMHPVQKELLKRFAADKLTVIEINSDKTKSLEAVRKKIEKDELEWIVVTDGPAGPLSKQWKVSAWPVYYVLDDHGRIRHRLSGNIGRKLIEVVEPLLAQGE